MLELIKDERLDVVTDAGDTTDSVYCYLQRRSGNKIESEKSKIDTATTVTINDKPGKLVFLSIHNGDTVARTVTLRVSANNINLTIYTGLMSAGQSLIISENQIKTIVSGVVS